MKATAPKKQHLTHERHAMVQRQIVRRGVRDELVLEAVRKVPREDFLPADMREFATRIRRCRSKKGRRSRSLSSLR
jgi:protein-L-isoaspartate O-methyltransferase